MESVERLTPGVFARLKGNDKALCANVDMYSGLVYRSLGINPDLFGDAYEYLMGMYAANAGKKGGQYFTPADVSELLARLGLEDDVGI